jgi:hypothetical protein
MTKKKTPPAAEQPTTAQPPLPELDRGQSPVQNLGAEAQGSAEDSAPMSAASPAPEAPVLNQIDPTQPVSMGMYIADIKTIITNQEALAAQIAELKGLKAEGKMPPPRRIEPGQQPAANQEPPQWLQALLPIVMQIGQNIIAPGKAEPSTLDKVFNEYMEKKKQTFAENILKSLEAGEQGRLWIGDQPPNPDATGKVR